MVGKSWENVRNLKGSQEISADFHLDSESPFTKHSQIFRCSGEMPRTTGSWWVVDSEVDRFLKREAVGLQLDCVSLVVLCHFHALDPWDANCH